MAQRLIIEIVGDASSLERAFRRTERSSRTFSSRVGRAAKVAGAAAGAALGAGITVGLKKSVDAAMEAQKVLGQTRVAVRNAGSSWVAYQTQIQQTTGALSRLSAINDEELLQSFSTLVRSTRDVTAALRLNAVAADLARARNMDVVSAARLLARVNAGNVGGLRRLGIQVDKNATSTQALAQVQRQFAGSAAAYGRSAAGAQERFNVALENFEETLGAALLPTLTTYLNQASKWLDNTENQRKAADTLKISVDLLTGAVKGLSVALEALAGFGDTLGGIAFKVSQFVKGSDFDEALRVYEAVQRIEQTQAARGATAHITDVSDRAASAAVAGAAFYPGGAPTATASPPAAPGRGATVEQRNQWFDAMIGRLLGRASDPTSVRAQIGRLRTIAGLIQQRLNVTKDITRRLRLEDDLADIAIQIRDRQQELADAATARRQQVAQDRAAAKAAGWDRQLGWLEFGIEKAEATKGIADDRRAYRALEKALVDKIRAEGRTLELVRDLWGVRQRIRDLNKSKADVDPLAGLMQVSSKRMAGLLGAGLGLSPAGLGRLQQNISGQEIHNYIHLDGREVARSTNRANAQTTHRTSRQTSGFRG